MQEAVQHKPGETIDKIVDSVRELGLAGLGGADAMRRKLQEYEDVRTVIHDYIERNFVREIDYGIVDDRNPKPALKKPGAEKACKMFDTHARWLRDDPVWEMLGKPTGVVCLICHIVDNQTGHIIGEGRGAERVGNKNRDINKTIKTAEKCALVDAALYTFMLSERFTQDDGGAGKTQLADAKEVLKIDLAEARAGVVSEMTDINFIVSVCISELHKKRMDTIKELMHVRKVIFEQALYDLGTAKKKETPDA